MHDFKLINENKDLSMAFKDYCLYKKPETCKTAARYIDAFIVFIKKDFFQYTQSDAENYYNHCLQEIRMGKAKGSSIRTRFRTLSAFAKHTSLNYNIDDHFSIYTKKLDHFDPDKVSVDKIIPPKTVDKILTCAAENHDYFLYTLITLAYVPGLKTNEICALKLNNLVTYGDRMFCRLPNKVIPLADETKEVLEKYIEIYKPIDYVFVKFSGSQKGTPLDKNYIKRILDRLCKKAGVGPITLQKLRNSSLAVHLSVDDSVNNAAEKYGFKMPIKAQRYDILPANFIEKLSGSDYENIRIIPPDTNKKSK